MGSAVLKLLQEADGVFLSGESMSQQLGITRAAVWKQVNRLRQNGYEIEATTNLGYRLIAVPDAMDPKKIAALLGEHPWKDRITVLETVDSTNSLAKRMALNGAPHGSIFLADEQTGGRGRQGRSFVSPRGTGIYLSVLLRPDALPTDLGHVTAMAAVAGCNTVEAVCGIRPGVKWMNDLILDGKKLCGILTEMSVEWESNALEYLVIGIGINCNHSECDFPEDIRSKATSLNQVIGKRVDRESLAATLIAELYRLNLDILSGKTQWISQYAQDCITIGQSIKITRGNSIRLAQATGIDENAALLVRYDTGETGVVFSGEVSIRGINGYI